MVIFLKSQAEIMSHEKHERHKKIIQFREEFLK